MSKILRISFYSVLFFLGFIWLHTFIRLNSYTNSSGIGSYILTVLISVIATAFYYWCFIGIIDPIESLSKISSRKCTTICDVICLVMVVAFVLELSTYSNLSIICKQDIQIMSLTISKRYVFDIFVAILFPIITEYALKAMTKEHLSRRSIIWGIVTILVMSLLGYLLFFVMPNIWLADMAVINIVTVTVGIIKYIFPQRKIRKGNLVGMVILYVMVYIALFSLLSYEGESLSEFMYGSTWPEYKEGVLCLVKNASLFGTSTTLLSSTYIHEWLVNRNNYIQQLLFYGGWTAVIGLIVFMAIFLRLLIHLLGLKNFKIHRHQLVYTAAFCILAIRTVMGTLYSFALLPYPVTLPFGGTYSIITDSIVFTLILYGAWENYKYERLITYEPVKPDIFLKKELNYKIFFKDKEDNQEEYKKEGLSDRVLIKNSGNDVVCDVEWTYGNDREIAVFIPHDNPNHQVFMLEHTKEDEWLFLENEDLYPEVMKEFIYYRIPDCMEVDDEDEDLKED